jgi:hypothetical protein
MISFQAMKQLRRSDISLEYRRKDLTFHMDWFQGLAVNGNPIQSTDFPRYIV